MKSLIKRHPILILYVILILGLSFRLIGINWDEGHHMHPDERAITLSVSELSYPASLNELLSPDSPLNPKFFAYGNFPFYLLKFLGDIIGFVDPLFATYDKINLLGRFVSAVFDVGTIVVIFLIGTHLKNRMLGYISAFLYAISVLPIQLSHFYAVDTILTFFLTLTLFLLLKLYEHPKLSTSLFIGILFGLSLATKISSTVIISSIILSLSLDFLLIFLKSPHRPTQWIGHLPNVLKRLSVYGIVIASASLLTFLITQPYALIDATTFVRQIEEQSHMTRDAFTFPYTLQYVGKIPYVYELKNIVLFGLGPLLGAISISGFFYCLYRVVVRFEDFPWQKLLILLQFFLTYFLITGSFAIGFMRYMLPLYPLLTLFAGILLYQFMQKYSPKQHKLFTICYVLFAIILLIWPLSFMNVYLAPNTKVTASDWIHTNIPQGSTLATEHWDDTLPLTNQFKYQMESLPMYEPDTSGKWTTVNGILERTDYIIIASNRLYVPLMKLTDCMNLPSHRCYLRTSLYYKELFDGTLGFEKVAEFTSYPTIPFTDIAINDQKADESFTVYDHPKIMIFKKTSHE